MGAIDIRDRTIVVRSGAMRGVVAKSGLAADGRALVDVEMPAPPKPQLYQVFVPTHVLSAYWPGRRVTVTWTLAPEDD